MPIPDNIRARLEQLRMEAALRAEMERRQQQAQANAEAMARGVQGKADGGMMSSEEREENLQRFLSNSRIRDRLYHATPKDFKQFKPGGNDPTMSGPAIWLSPHAEKQPAAHNIGGGDRGFKEGTNVMPVHVQARSPLLLDDRLSIEWAREVYADGSREFPDLLSPKTVQELKKDGYDSIIHADPYGNRGGEHEIIMFDPQKIKSAIGNRGTYDVNDPDITMADGGLAHLAIGGQSKGNWVQGEIERALDPLKINHRDNTPENEAELQAEMQEATSRNDQRMLAAVQADMRGMKHGHAINQWIDRNLANYIRKQMATENDPIRKLAEQGVVHMQPEQMGYGSSQAGMVRQKLGAPQLAQSDAAKAWEDAADVAMHPMLIKDLHRDYREPWMAKAEPDAKIMTATDSLHAHYLGFDHIVDILKQDLTEGRIRPEQLSKVSIEQAVRRVHEYDQERAKAMREASLKQTEGMPVHKDYGDGFKWIELTLPKNALPEGWQEVEINGKKWLKNEKGEYVHEDDDPREQKLKDALKYEGDTMGHCVGGYCPDVASGKSRIFSLRDAKNEPHVTIEVNPHSQRVAPRHEEVLSEMKASGLDTANMAESDYDAAYEQALQRVKQNRPPAIKQIKGKGNAKPKKDYIPYVQDFVKGGNWSEVNESQNADLRHIKDIFNPNEIGKLQQQGIDIPQHGFLTGDQIQQMHNAITPEGKRLKYDSAGKIVGGEPGSGYAKGGEVKTPSLDTMRLALNKQGMYSPLEKAAMAVPRSKGTPAEFMAEISKQPGFRKDEVEDRKISLPEQKMTKEEFLGHLKNHPAPLIKEHLLGGNEMQEALDQIAQDIIGDEDATFDDLHGRDRDAALYDVKQNYGYDPETKYEDYALPGGDNYRELLLTLPSSGLSKNEKDQKMWLEATQRRGQLTPEQDVQLMKLQIKEQRAKPDYQSNHWEGHPNVLAHMRLSDRFVPNENGPYNVKVMQGRAFSNVKFPSREEAEQFADVKRQGGYQTEVKPTTNKKILHVEEIQSDWHQQGRKDGYTDGQATNAYNAEIKRLAEKYGVSPDEPNLPSKVRPFMNVEEFDKMLDMEKASRNGVPDAPFKKNWHELALKHALGMAAKGGYHGIAITPGDVQADRYDLSKHIDKINYNRNPDGTYSLSAHKDGRDIFTKNDLSERELESHVGKEVASKIVSGEGEDAKNAWGSHKSLSGLDLKVGGEGMKGFYDKIVPAYLNKLGKPHGAQVSSISVNAPNQEKWGVEDVAKFHGMTGSDYLDLDHPTRSQLEKQFLQDRQNATTDLHYFPMTESMRQQIKGEGMPQYERGGEVKGLDHFFESGNSLDHFFQE